MPTRIIISTKGTSMKKTALVLVIAAILIFAFAATAMADTTSGGAVAPTDTRYDWNPAAPNNNPETPHKGYAYNTTKCLVCHAVHKAPAAGEVLLGTTVASACNFCHVDATGISSKLVYGGDGVVGADNDNGHQISCTLCHAVHGANTVNQAALSSSILKADIATAQNTAVADWNMNTGSELGALSAYCTQCHPYFTNEYAAADTAGDVTSAPYIAGTWNSHIMTSDFGAYNPVDDSANPTGATKIGIAVAYASSAYCTSCHDAGRNATFTSTDSFPHETLGARFMKSADYLGATSHDAAVPNEDGVCLKCHRSSATTGVQFNF